MPRLCPPEPPPTPAHLRCLCVWHSHFGGQTCAPGVRERVDRGWETGFWQVWPTCPQHGWTHDWSTPEGLAAATWLLIIGHEAYRKDPCRLNAQMSKATEPLPSPAARTRPGTTTR